MADKSREKGRGGFTLVELLVVIGIIAILVGVLLPALNKARQSAQEVQSASNMRQFGMGFQIYADANQGFLPLDGPDGTSKASASGGGNLIGRVGPNDPAYDSHGNYVPTGVDDPALWYNAVPPLVNNRAYSSLIKDYVVNGNQSGLPSAGANSIWVCPAAGQPVSTIAEIYNSQSTSPSVGSGNYFGLWGTDNFANSARPLYRVQAYPFYQCYVFNSKLFTSLNTSPTTYITKVKLAQLRPGSDVVLMTEKIMQDGEFSQRTDPEVSQYLTTINPPNKNLTSDLSDYASNLGQPKATNTRFTTRHRHGGNLLFADGHVSWFAWSQVQGIVVSGNVPTINREDNHVIWSPYGNVQNGSGD